ncbi:MAG: hypothetical protein HCA25_25900 [Dolichospermum sp. DET50]|nr:hypothetical protein [Dolichospermum sp. DET66]MBS3035566.1 hypothetical protein [Dolichospermum sp. DET67]MBS3040768.1 hypothetical protein [Dolichospermum sp. DET50]QSX67886.1 MAG: hypothetical protein EZY12_25165 [Dolichospermum sp. DET69]
MRYRITNFDSNQLWSDDIPRKLILLDTKDFSCRTFADYFAGLPNVEIVNGTIKELPIFDCVVTAASSLTSANSKVLVSRWALKIVVITREQRTPEEVLGYFTFRYILSR